VSCVEQNLPIQKICKIIHNVRNIYTCVALFSWALCASDLSWINVISHKDWLYREMRELKHILILDMMDEFTDACGQYIANMLMENLSEDEMEHHNELPAKY
jgi:hypothetical protein